MDPTYVQKFLQFGERSLTTLCAILDKTLFDVVPDKLAGGSTGIANMSRNTLFDAVSYIKQVYGREPMPDHVKYRIAGWNQDTRISGDDLRADLYYAAAHLRQLIDRVMKKQKYYGTLSLDDFEKVCAGYNGSGPLAVKYGKDARKRLERAVSGQEKLYFYQE